MLVDSEEGIIVLFFYSGIHPVPALGPLELEVTE